MKTPEEIKKGLESCNSDECHGNHTDCPYVESDMCMSFITGDALAYIQQLEAELADVKRERDAAVRDMTYVTRCESCKHYCVDIGGFPCNKCAVVHKGAGIMWEWRGLCSENGGADDGK